MPNPYCVFGGEPIESRDGESLEGVSSSHKHAVASLSSGETYTYDANGNMITRVEGGLTYTQTFNAENQLISVTVSGQTTQFIGACPERRRRDGDGNLVKKVKPDNSKTIYVGGIYEVDKASGGSIQRTVTYYPVAGAKPTPTCLPQFGGGSIESPDGKSSEGVSCPQACSGIPQQRRDLHLRCRGMPTVSAHRDLSRAAMN